MSNTKRGETTPCQGNGPYFSRYTEHKLVVNGQSFDPSLSPNRLYSVQPSPVRNSSLETYRQGSVSSTDTAYSPSRSGSVDRTSDSGFDLSFDTRFAPSEIPIPSDRRSAPDFLSISPNVYNRPLSAFRSSSVESCRSVSPQSATSPDGSARDRRVSFFEKNSFVNNTNNTKPKGTFASIINKHAVTIFAAATFKFAHGKVKKKHAHTLSCPELTSQPSPCSDVINKRVKTYSHGELCTITKDSSTLVKVCENKLKVPDIFTTSYTHSKDVQIHRELETVSKPPAKNGSLQDIPDVASPIPQLKYLRRRTTSLTKPDANGLNQTIMYKDEQVAQVTNYLYIGSIESAYNERRLCRLEVESLVDISNVSEMQVPSHKKTQCPCLCQTEYKHFRSRLIIAVADEENDDIDQYFEEVNRFIEGARRCSKKVLIYSYEGKSRAALFAIQYLMSFEGLLLRQAYNLVKKHRPSVTLNPSFQRALENLEKKLFPDEKHSVNICNEYLNVADPQAIKCAWIDC